MASALLREKLSWLMHSMTRADSPSRLSLVETDTVIKLCYYRSKMYGSSYKHYFLYFFPSRCIAEIHGEDHFNAIFEIHNETIKTEIIIESDPETKFTPEMKERLREVEHMNNYSLLLRNCEHITKYVFYGLWVSVQVVNETDNNVFRLYMSDATENAKKLINSRPVGLGQQRAVSNYGISLHDRWNLTPSFTKPERNFEDRDAFNVLLIGPTGAGKSNLINYFYKQSIAESKRSASGITQEVLFYPGTIDGKQNICFIDTIGICDGIIPTPDVIKMMAQFIRNQPMKIHRILIVVGERIRAPELKDLQDYKKKLKFGESLNENNFTLVLTKCEDMDSNDERKEYVESFYKFPEFANFKNDFEGTSLLTKQKVKFKRTVTVGLKDLSKVTAKDIDSAQRERDDLLESILIELDPIAVEEQSCCRIL